VGACLLVARDRQKFPYRRDPIRADEPVYLYPERHKRDEIYKPKSAKKPATRPEIRRRAYVFSPQRPGNQRADSSVPGDHLVSELRDRGKAGNVLVAPRQPFFRTSAAQRSVNRVCCREHITFAIDENDRAFELRARNFRKLPGNFLRRGVVDLSIGNHLPTLNPMPAKMTIAVPNHERLGRWMGNARKRFLLHQRHTLSLRRQRPANKEDEAKPDPRVANRLVIPRPRRPRDLSLASASHKLGDVSAV
jgi:hypothetical protein